MIPIKDRDPECFLRSEVIGEAALRNSCVSGDLTNTSAREAALVERRDAGLNDFFS